jgi:hypothetical protein
MKQEPKNRVEMRDFVGLQSNLDRHDIPPGGSTAQVNAQCIRPGELRVRGGLRDVTFEIEDG